MKRLFILAVILSLVNFPKLSQAQWSVGPHIIVSIPQQDFANISDTGGGFGIKGMYRFASLHGLSLRGDFGFISYGTDFRSVNIGGTIVPARTENMSFRLTFGPQFSFGTGRLKIQFFGMGGFYFYSTNVTVSDGFIVFTDSQDNLARLGWNVGGGFLYDIGLGPWLDIAVEYNTINNIPGPADENNPDNRIDIDAKEITLKIGVVFFLGR
ncbi:MAG: outer membrane beta-barrel protein [bacterium]